MPCYKTPSDKFKKILVYMNEILYLRNPRHYSAYNSYGSRKHYTVLQGKALETQLTLLVFEQKFHVKAENVLHCQISLFKNIYI